MEQPFRLVPDRISEETARACEQLAKEARAGTLIGIAFAGMRRQRTYFVNAAGECRRNPTFARGMIAALDEKLSRWIRGG